MEMTVASVVSGRDGGPGAVEPPVKEASVMEPGGVQAEEEDHAPGAATVGSKATPESSQGLPVDGAEGIRELLLQADSQIQANKLIFPEEDNAFRTVREIMAMAPGHPGAEERLSRIARRYLSNSWKSKHRAEVRNTTEKTGKPWGLRPHTPA